MKTGEGFGKFFGVFKLYYFIVIRLDLLNLELNISIKLRVSSYTPIISSGVLPRAVLNLAGLPPGLMLPHASRLIAILVNLYRVVAVNLPTLNSV